MNFEAAIFDMDGVITKTAVVHSSAWKRTFDEYLRIREARFGEVFREFTGRDYLDFVDGRPRYAGVDSFLRSRAIAIPFGDPADTPGTETVCGLGNRKNEFFNRLLEDDGVAVYGSTIRLIEELLRSGVRVGVATSSKNCALVLEKAGIADLFETRVDGVVSATLGLKGKPEPDIFATACGNLGVSKERAMVVEDAVSGVQAGASGHFGLVLGVAREDNGAELRRNGADIVVSDLAEISLVEIDSWFKSDARIHNRSIKDCDKRVYEKKATT
jgi:HAD superfamily hydrolase (TIGR01509 family)